MVFWCLSLCDGLVDYWKMSLAMCMSVSPGLYLIAFCIILAIPILLIDLLETEIKQTNNYISPVIESQLFIIKRAFSNRFTLVIPTHC